MTENIRNLLAVDTNRVVSSENTVDHYGLLRHTGHAHGTLNCELNDRFSISVLGGFNREKFSTLIDLDRFDTSMLTSAYSPSGYFDFPYVIERDNRDWSAKGRLNFDWQAARCHR